MWHTNDLFFFFCLVSWLTDWLMENGRGLSRTSRSHLPVLVPYDCMNGNLFVTGIPLALRPHKVPAPKSPHLVQYCSLVPQQWVLLYHLTAHDLRCIKIDMHAWFEWHPGQTQCYWRPIPGLLSSSKQSVKRERSKLSHSKSRSFRHWQMMSYSAFMSYFSSLVCRKMLNELWNMQHWYG